MIKLIPPELVYSIWTKVVECEEKRDFEYENEISERFEQLGLIDIRDELGYKNYIIGASGINHEIDICSYDKKNNILLICECKSGKRVKLRDIFNFKAKCEDIIPIIEGQYKNATIYRVIITPQSLPYDSYKFCLYSNIIPLDGGMQKIPIFIQNYALNKIYNEISKSTHIKSQLLNKRKEEIDYICTFISNDYDIIFENSAYDVKKDNLIRNDGTDLYKKINNELILLNILDDLGYDINNYLFNEIKNRNIQSRMDYIKSRSELRSIFNIDIEEFNEAIIITKMLENSIKPKKIINILPKDYFSYVMTENIIKKRINNVKSFNRIRSKIKNMHGYLVNYYSMINTAFNIYNDQEIIELLNFIKKEIKLNRYELYFSTSRYIIKQILREKIVSKKELNECINRQNYLFRINPKITNWSIVNNAKSTELTLLNRLLPYRTACRIISDMINLNKVTSYNEIKDTSKQVANYFWLSQFPHFSDIIKSSAHTQPTMNFFTRNNLHYFPPLKVKRPELIEGIDLFDELLEIQRIKNVTRAQICDACHQNIASRLEFVGADNLLLCEECADLLA